MRALKLTVAAILVAVALLWFVAAVFSHAGAVEWLPGLHRFPAIVVFAGPAILGYAAAKLLKGSPREAIKRLARAKYGKDATAVMRELDRCPDSPTISQHRVHRAIIYLSTNSLDNVKRWVELALGDYRDVVGPAEYPDEHTAENVRRFNE